MADLQHVNFLMANRIGWLEIHRAPSNIIDFDLMDELSWVLEQAESCAILIISSTLPHFSLGVDIKIHTPDLVPEMLSRFHEVIRKLYHFPGIAVCVLNGYALGGGLELALCCDLLIAGQNTQFGFPEIRLACFPPVAAALLPRMIGRRAIELLICGETLRAERALELGLIDHVFPDHDREEFVSKFIGKFSSYSHDALQALKKAMRHSDGFDFEDALRRSEEVYRSELIQSPDLVEGVKAFLQKRPPKFRR